MFSAAPQPDLAAGEAVDPQTQVVASSVDPEMQQFMLDYQEKLERELEEDARQAARAAAQGQAALDHAEQVTGPARMQEMLRGLSEQRMPGATTRSLSEPLGKTVPHQYGRAIGGTRSMDPMWDPILGAAERHQQAIDIPAVEAAVEADRDLEDIVRRQLRAAENIPTDRTPLTQSAPPEREPPKKAQRRALSEGPKPKPKPKKASPKKAKKDVRAKSAPMERERAADIPPRALSEGSARPEHLIAPPGMPTLEEAAGQAGKEQLGEDTGSAKDPCDDVLDALRTLASDMSNPTKQRLAVSKLKAIATRAQGTDARGKELMELCRAPEWNSPWYNRVSELAIELCRVHRKAGADLPAAQKYWTTKMRKRIHWGDTVETVDKTLTPWHKPEDLMFFKKLVMNFEGKNVDLPGAVRGAHEFMELGRKAAQYARRGARQLTQAEQGELQEVNQRREKLATRYGFRREIPSAHQVPVAEHRRIARGVSKQAKKDATRHAKNAKNMEAAEKRLSREVSKDERELAKLRQQETKALGVVARNQKGRPTNAKQARIEKASKRIRDLSSSIAETEAGVESKKRDQARLAAATRTEKLASNTEKRRSKAAAAIARAKKGASPDALDRKARAMDPSEFKSELVAQQERAHRSMRKRPGERSLEDELGLQPLPKRKRKAPEPIEAAPEPVPTDFSDVPERRTMRREYFKRVQDDRDRIARDKELQRQDEARVQAQEEEKYNTLVARRKNYWDDAKKSQKVPTPLKEVQLDAISDRLSEGQILSIVDALRNVFGDMVDPAPQQTVVKLKKPQIEFATSLSRKKEVTYSDLANLANLADIAVPGLDTLKTALKRKSRVKIAAKRSVSTSMPGLVSRSADRSPSPSRSPSEERSGRERDRRDWSMDAAQRARSQSPRSRRKVSPGRSKSPRAKRGGDRRIRI